MKKDKTETITNPVKEARRYVDNANKVLQKYGKMDLETGHYSDRKLLALVNDAYDMLHLQMGYDGVLNKKVCDEGFLVATEIIDRCAVMLPVSPAA